MASRFHSGPPDDFNDPGADDALFFESLFEEAEREVRSVRQVRSSRSDAVAGKAKPEEQSFRRRASAEPNRASDSVNSASARYSRSRTAAFGSASMGVSRTRSVSGRPAVSPFMPPPVYPKEPPSLMSVMAAERGESVPAFEGTAALMNRASPDREGAIEEAKPLTVSETLTRIRNALDGVIDGLWISGEVAAVKTSGAGHVYFSIKDERGLIDCVLFGGARQGRRLFVIGNKIEIRGRTDIYAERGKLQIIASQWRPAGQGSLYEAFLRLKAKLEAEGLFDASKKRPIPGFVRRVALVTSSIAAAYGDVCRTIERRTPWVQILHVEAPVQGADAPARLIAALRAADRTGADVVLLVRGGGAYEDLQAFNDEKLARAIRAMRTPVISGVGHEADFTIADFAADLRASTPTAAAESIGPDREYWMKRLEKLFDALSGGLTREIQHAMQRFDRAQTLMPDMDLRLANAERAVSLMAERFKSADFALRTHSERVERAAAFLADPERVLSAPERVLEDRAEQFLAMADLQEKRRGERLGWPGERLNDAIERKLGDAEREYRRAHQQKPDPMRTVTQLGLRLAQAETALKLADPDRPLRAGYARISSGGRVVGAARDLSKGNAIEVRFFDGEARAVVERVSIRSEKM